MKARIGRLRSLAIGVLCTVSLGGCGDGNGSSNSGTAEALRASIPEYEEYPAPQADTTYVGRIADTGTLITVVLHGAAAVAYVCDGAEISEWFLGTVDGNSIELTGDEGGLLFATVHGDAVEGTVFVVDEYAEFSISLAVESESGVYRFVEGKDEARTVTGWIFFEGQLRGATEDSGKGVVAAASVNGIDTATGTGTGTGTPAPPPVAQSCGALFCQWEQAACDIRDLHEVIKQVKGKAVKQAAQLLTRAQARLVSIVDKANANGCLNAGNNDACGGTFWRPSPGYQLTC